MTAATKDRHLPGGLLWWHYSFKQRRLFYMVAITVAVETLWLAFANVELNGTFSPHGIGIASVAPLTRCTGSVSQCVSTFKAAPPFVGPLTDLVIYLLPAICAVAFIAPSLAKEFESKSIRFTWTQAMTRNQWLSARLFAALGAALVVSAIGQVELHTWVWHHYYLTGPPWGMFSFSGTVAVGIALLLAAAAVLLAILIKRPAPVMLGTAVLYGALLLAVTGLFPTLLSPQTKITPPATASQPQGSYYVSSTTVTKTGERVSSSSVAAIVRQCSQDAIATGPGGTLKAIIGPGTHIRESYSSCMTSHGLYVLTAYQPSYRYWELQWIFAAMALAATAAIVAGTYFATKKLEV